SVRHIFKPISYLEIQLLSGVSGGYIIHHPYAAREIDDEWQILVYLPFTQAFTDVSEAAFIRMRVATEQDFWQRKTAWIVLN
ncbi:hypothetical protein VBL71_10355, partial [Enterobacter hormaechei]|nr:hypothetical protein [Enterobacter hormaechei]